MRGNSCIRLTPWNFARSRARHLFATLVLEREIHNLLHNPAKSLYLPVKFHSPGRNASCGALDWHINGRNHHIDDILFAKFSNQQS